MKLIKYCFLLAFLFSCKTSTKISVDKTNTLLPNNEVIELEKTNKDSETFGSITNYHYGSRHSFKYKFKLINASVKWDGGTAEPKKILFNKDSIFITYLKNKHIATPYLDTVTNTTKNTYHYEVQRFYQKHIDKRYFFKLLGKDYWLDITENNYLKNLKEGSEYTIKTDNELTLPVKEVKQ